MAETSKREHFTGMIMTQLRGRIILALSKLNFAAINFLVPTLLINLSVHFVF